MNDYNFNIGTKTWLEQYELRARRIVSQHKEIKRTSNRTAANYRLLEEIYRFSIEIVQTEKIRQMHQFLVDSSPKLQMQPRYCYAIIMLLLNRVEPNFISRQKRSTYTQILRQAQRQGVHPENLIGWIVLYGGTKKF